MDAGIQDDLKIVGEDVWLTVPPFSEYLRTVRLVAADAAVRAGLDYDEVEDFRIAVDELSHAVMTATDHHLHVTFRTSDDKVVARGTARGRNSVLPPAMTELSSTIVTGVADFFDFRQEKSEVVFVVVKHAQPSVVGHA